MSVRRLLKNIFIITAFATMYAALLGLAVWLTGRIVSDRYEWSQWIAWTPTPVAIALAGVGFLCAWRPGGTTRRRRVRRISWGVSLFGLVVYFALFEHHLFSARDCDVQGLRIVHWNSSATPRAQTNDAAALLAELDGDVTILTNHGAIHRRQPIREWMGEDGFVLRPQPFAVMSKLPVLEARTVVSSEQMHVVVLRLDAAASLGQDLTIWLIDLPSNPETPRMETARTVRAWIDKANLPPADIILGDFNMTRGSASLKVIAPTFRHAFDVAGVGYGATYPRKTPWLHIDHMLVADSIEPLSYCVRNPGVSTHRLQLMTVKSATE